jgi:hypothetical protein
MSGGGSKIGRGKEEDELSNISLEDEEDRFGSIGRSREKVIEESGHKVWKVRKTLRR